MNLPGADGSYKIHRLIEACGSDPILLWEALLGEIAICAGQERAETGWRIERPDILNDFVSSGLVSVDENVQDIILINLLGLISWSYENSYVCSKAELLVALLTFATDAQRALDTKVGECRPLQRLVGALCRTTLSVRSLWALISYARDNAEAREWVFGTLLEGLKEPARPRCFYSLQGRHAGILLPARFPVNLKKGYTFTSTFKLYASATQLVSLPLIALKGPHGHGVSLNLSNGIFVIRTYARQGKIFVTKLADKRNLKRAYDWTSWHWICLVHSRGFFVPDKVTLYIDGEKVFRGSHPYFDWARVYDGQNTIGTDLGQQRFCGQIYGPSFFSHAMSETEVHHLYEATRGGQGMLAAADVNPAGYAATTRVELTTQAYNNLLFSYDARNCRDKERVCVDAGPHSLNAYLQPGTSVIRETSIRDCLASADWPTLLLPFFGPMESQTFRCEWRELSCSDAVHLIKIIESLLGGSFECRRIFLESNVVTALSGLLRKCGVGLLKKPLIEELWALCLSLNFSREASHQSISDILLELRIWKSCDLDALAFLFGDVWMELAEQLDPFDSSVGVANDLTIYSIWQLLRRQQEADGDVSYLPQESWGVVQPLVVDLLESQLRKGLRQNPSRAMTLVSELCASPGVDGLAELCWSLFGILSDDLTDDKDRLVRVASKSYLPMTILQKLPSVCSNSGDGEIRTAAAMTNLLCLLSSGRVFGRDELLELQSMCQNISRSTYECLQILICGIGNSKEAISEQKRPRMAQGHPEVLNACFKWLLRSRADVSCLFLADLHTWVGNFKAFLSGKLTKGATIAAGFVLDASTAVNILPHLLSLCRTPGPRLQTTAHADKGTHHSSYVKTLAAEKCLPLEERVALIVDCTNERWNLLPEFLVNNTCSDSYRSLLTDVLSKADKEVLRMTASAVAYEISVQVALRILCEKQMGIMSLMAAWPNSWSVASKTCFLADVLGDLVESMDELEFISDSSQFWLNALQHSALLGTFMILEREVPPENNILLAGARAQRTMLLILPKLGGEAKNQNEEAKSFSRSEIELVSLRLSATLFAHYAARGEELSTDSKEILGGIVDCFLQHFRDAQILSGSFFLGDGSQAWEANYLVGDNRGDDDKLWAAVNILEGIETTLSTHLQWVGKILAAFLDRCADQWESDHIHHLPRLLSSATSEPTEAEISSFVSEWRGLLDRLQVREVLKRKYEKVWNLGQKVEELQREASKGHSLISTADVAPTRSKSFASEGSSSRKASDARLEDRSFSWREAKSRTKRQRLVETKEAALDILEMASGRRGPWYVFGRSMTAGDPTARSLWIESSSERTMYWGLDSMETPSRKRLRVRREIYGSSHEDCARPLEDVVESSRDDASKTSSDVDGSDTAELDPAHALIRDPNIRALTKKSHSLESTDELIEGEDSDDEAMLEESRPGEVRSLHEELLQGPESGTAERRTVEDEVEESSNDTLTRSSSQEQEIRSSGRPTNDILDSVVGTMSRAASDLVISAKTAKNVVLSAGEVAVDEADSIIDDIALFMKRSESPITGKTDSSTLTSLPLALEGKKLLFTMHTRLIKCLLIISGRLYVTQDFLIFEPVALVDEQGNALTKKVPMILQKLIRCKVWQISQICAVFRRRFLLQNTAVEFFLSDTGENFLFDFNKGGSRRFYRQLIAHKKCSLRKAPMYRRFRAPASILRGSNLTKSWQDYHMSTFEYLMHLNTAAGRSYNDLTQYPVLPWILSDYRSTTLDLSRASTFRDLSRPVGALNPDRLALFREKYHAFRDDETPPFMYGSHYSNLGAVLYFLLRLEPFTSIALSVQGGRFDHADRLFHSVDETWRHCCESNWDVKELIPEFFYLPEFLVNTNGLPLGRRQNGILLGDVVLPPWAKSAEEFVRLHAMALESDYVSENLCHWIDLIFGYKQRGEKAVDADNVFFHLTYEGAVDLQLVKDPVLLASIKSQIVNFGQTPSQLLQTPHPTRTLSSENVWSSHKRSENQQLLVHEIPGREVVENSSGVVALFESLSGKVSALYSDGRVIVYQCGSKVSLEDRKDSFYSGYAQPSPVKTWQLPQSFLNQLPLQACLETSPQSLVQLPELDAMVVAGFADCTAKLVSLVDGVILQSIRQHRHVVGCVAVCPRGRLLALGSDDGTISLWRYEGKPVASGFSLKLLPGHGQAKLVPFIANTPFGILHGHDRPITTMDLCSLAGVAVSGSGRTTILVHSIFDGTMLRQIEPDFRSPTVALQTRVNDSGHIVIAFSPEDAATRTILSVYTVNGTQLSQERFEGKLNTMQVGDQRRADVVVAHGKQLSLLNLEPPRVKCSVDLPGGALVISRCVESPHAIFCGLHTGQLVTCEILGKENS